MSSRVHEERDGTWSAHHETSVALGQSHSVGYLGQYATREEAERALEEHGARAFACMGAMLRKSLPERQ